MKANLEDLNKTVRKEFAKLSEYTPNELWYTQSTILLKIEAIQKELQQLKQKYNAQGLVGKECRILINKILGENQT